MGTFLKLLTVLALGSFELWAAVPAGIALGLQAAAVGVTAATGALLGTVAVIVFGEHLREWYARRQSGEREKRVNRAILWIWERYGLVGLGLSAPWITGAPIGAAVGLALGAPARRLFFWLCIGIVLCTIVLTVVSALSAPFHKFLSP